MKNIATSKQFWPYIANFHWLPEGVKWKMDLFMKKSVVILWSFLQNSALEMLNEFALCSVKMIKT